MDHLKSYQGRGGGELSSRMNIFFLTVPLYEFFRPVHEYLLGLLGAHNIFSFNFSCKNLAFFQYFAHLLRPLINSLMVGPLSYNSFSELNSLIDQLLHNWSRSVHTFTSSFLVTYHRLIEEGYFPPKAEWAQYQGTL